MVLSGDIYHLGFISPHHHHNNHTVSKPVYADTFLHHLWRENVKKVSIVHMKLPWSLRILEVRALKSVLEEITNLKRTGGKMQQTKTKHEYLMWCSWRELSVQPLVLKRDIPARGEREFVAPQACVEPAYQMCLDLLRSSPFPLSLEMFSNTGFSPRFRA